MHLRSLVLDGFAFVRGGGQRRTKGTAVAPSGSSDTRRLDPKQKLLSGAESTDSRSKKSPKKESKGERNREAKRSSTKSKRESGKGSKAEKREKESRQVSDPMEPDAKSAGDEASSRGAGLAEQAVVAPNLHQSQAKIKVVGING